MTVAYQENKTSATGSAAAGQVVPFLFPIDTSSDLVVKMRVTATGVDTLLAETTNYTVFINDDLGGSVTTVTAIETTETIHVYRETPRTQTLDLHQGGSFNAENIEATFDKITRAVIDNTESLDSCLRLPPTDSSTLTAELDSSVDRASKNLSFDSDGQPTVSVVVETGEVAYSDLGESIVGAATESAARALLSLDTTDDVEFAQVTATDIITKGPWIDVRAYDVAGDAEGTADGSLTDNTTALTNAFAAAGDKTLVFESNKVYKTTDTLVVPEGCTVELNGSKIVFIVTGAERCLSLRSYTTVRNGTVENAGTAPASGGNFQCPILIGNYDSGVGYRNIVLESLELENNRPGGNLIFITSDSENIRVNNIYVASNATVGAIVNMHFGGVAVYDSTGTTHPHNIFVNNIRCDGMSRANSYMIHTRGAYNVTVTNVTADNVNGGIIAGPGDAGKDFIKNDYEADLIGTGISYENVNLGSVAFRAVYVQGAGAVWGGITTTDLELPVSFRNCNFFGSYSDTLAQNGATLGACNGVKFDHCRFSDFFYNGISLSGGNPEKTIIENCEIDNNGYCGITHGTTSVSGHRIVNNYIHGNNIETRTNAAESSGIYINANDIVVDDNTIGETSETQKYGIYLGTDSKRCALSNNRVVDATDTAYYVNSPTNRFDVHVGTNNTLDESSSASLLTGTLVQHRYNDAVVYDGDVLTYNGEVLRI